MKTQLIKISDKFILVNDEEIKEDDHYLNTESGNPMYNKIYKGLKNIIKNGYLGKGYKDPDYFKKNMRKIIAGIPELPSIDFSLLSESDCKTIGWVDVEKLAADFANTELADDNGLLGNFYSLRTSFLEGFKTAQSLNDKMFSLEDMRKAWDNGNNYHKGSLIQASQFTFDKTIQSLQQPKVWDVEIEGDWNKEFYNLEDTTTPKVWQPKITNGSIKVIKVL